MSVVATQRAAQERMFGTIFDLSEQASEYD